MNRPISGDEIAERLEATLDKLHETLAHYRTAMIRAAEARAEAQAQFARAFVNTKASSGERYATTVERQVNARDDIRQLNREAAIAEAERDVTREALRALHATLDVLRTLAANQRQVEKDLR